MGFFSNLYLMEVQAVNDDTVSIRTEVYAAESGDVPYFSSIEGKRDGLLNSYAHDTIFCSLPLKLLPHYPVNERQELGSRTGHIPPSALIRAGFNPDMVDSATVCHVLLPDTFLPRRDLEPLVQPSVPYVKRKADWLILTWPMQGAFRIEFCITPLEEGDSLDNYDISKVLRKKDEPRVNVGAEINLGVLKFRFGR